MQVMNREVRNEGPHHAMHFDGMDTDCQCAAIILVL